mgnify:CR=1 FL=1
MLGMLAVAVCGLGYLQVSTSSSSVRDVEMTLLVSAHQGGSSSRVGSASLELGDAEHMVYRSEQLLEVAAPEPAPDLEPVESAEAAAPNVLEVRAKTSIQLREACEGLFEPLWDAGAFTRVEAIHGKELRDLEGYPLPNQIRPGPDGTMEFIVLDPQEFPEVCQLFRTLHDLDAEIAALQQTSAP